MDRLYAADICQMPEAWANTKTWQEACSKSNVHPQNSHHDCSITNIDDCVDTL